MKKPTTSNDMAGTQSHDHNTCLAAQRQRLKAHLEEHGSIPTYEARQDLAIASPAPRIMELRARGYAIITLLQDLPDANGVIHPRRARYVLLSKEAANDD